MSIYVYICDTRYLLAGAAHIIERGHRRLEGAPASLSLAAWLIHVGRVACPSVSRVTFFQKEMQDYGVSAQKRVQIVQYLNYLVVAVPLLHVAFAHKAAALLLLLLLANPPRQSRWISA